MSLVVAILHQLTQILQRRDQAVLYLHPQPTSPAGPLEAMMRRGIAKRPLDHRLASRQQLPTFGLWQTPVGPIDIALAGIAANALALFAHLAAKARLALLARMADRRFGAIDHLPSLVRLDRLTLQ